MTIPRNVFAKLAEAILDLNAKKATKFISPTETVKATLQGKRRKNERQTTILFTVGRPNYAERKFIADCRKAGVSFPVTRVLLKWDKTRAKTASRR